MALAEPRDHCVVRDAVADNESIANVTVAEPLDRPAGGDVGIVGIANEAEPASCQFLIEFIKDDVR